MPMLIAGVACGAAALLGVIALAWALIPSKHAQPDPLAGLQEIVPTPEQVKPADNPPSPRDSVPPLKITPEETDTPAPPAPVKVSPPPVAVTPPALPPQPPQEKPTVPPPAAEKPKPKTIVVKRRSDDTEEDLRRQIVKAPELRLDQAANRAESHRVVSLAQAAHAEGRRIEVLATLLHDRPDLSGLPFRMGEECHLSPAGGDHLQAGSVALRAHLATAATPANFGGGVIGRRPVVFDGDHRPDPVRLHTILAGDGDRHNKWLKAEAIPALQQLLMAENEAIREVLVEQLAGMEGSKGSVALAQRAVFDLHPGVRKFAIEALAKRPVEEYRQTLLDGFRHPWQPVVDHAAEAVVALKVTDAIPSVLAMLDQPTSDQPSTRPGKEGLYVKEMVRINHFRNCILCHAISFNTEDKVRGLVPRTDQPLGSVGGGYGGGTGTFIRADVTYLKQDFSVPLEVKNPGVWPGVQRFDFMVRERPATVAEIKTLKPEEPRPVSEYQKTLFFTLRGLTGKDPGPSPEDWKRLFFNDSKATKVMSGLQAIAGIAAGDGKVYVSADGNLLASNGKAAPWTLASGGFHSVVLTSEGKLLACKGNRIVEVNPDSGKVTTLAERYRDRPLVAPCRLAADRNGGVYFTDRPVSIPEIHADNGSCFYLSSRGVLTRLPLKLAHPSGVAVAPDGKTLYLQATGSHEVHAYPLEGAGLPGAGKLFCRSEMRDRVGPGGVGLAVDAAGNLLVPNPLVGAVEVFNPSGGRLRVLSLPESPVDCAMDGKTLYVAGRTAIYAVQVESATGVAAR
jgi:sugar lactone lactonase YvrE